MLKEAWYIAAESQQLKSTPLSREVANVPLVLFRNAQGQATALFDRCPHRNVKLSAGKVRQGQLQCPYHGWRFNSQGQCVHIPAQESDQAIPKSACTPMIPLREQQGYLWVWVGERPPRDDEQPFYIPYFEVSGWGWGRLQTRIANSVENTIENFIDNPHTGYIHGGLFRSEANHWSESEVQMTTDGVVIEIEEEQDENSLLAKLLVRGEVSHQDRYIYPSTVQVRYGFGPGREMVGYQICTPVSSFETQVYVHVNWQMGWLNPFVKTLMPLVGKIILQQDIAILNNQGEMIERYGEHFTSIEADSANLWIRAARARLARGEANPTQKKRLRFRV